VTRPPTKAINPKMREVSWGRAFLTTTITPNENRSPPKPSLQLLEIDREAATAGPQFHCRIVSFLYSAPLRGSQFAKMRCSAYRSCLSSQPGLHALPIQCRMLRCKPNEAARLGRGLRAGCSRCDLS
jgi:hypothetical protein